MQSNKTFSPKELALVIGVSQSSIKRWVDAGRIEVTRTAGGHRRILLSEALRFIRAQKMRILRPDLLGLPNLESLTTEMQVGGLTGDMLLHVLEAEDAMQARGLITGAFLSGQKPAALFDGPIKEAIAALGARWRDDANAIYLEHQATEIIMQAIHQIHALIPLPDQTAPVAVGCAPQNDPYLLPSMMAATVLADQGYRDVNLGAHTPPTVLARAADMHQARLVWLAATSGHAFVDDMHEWQAVLTQLQERNVHVVIGGQAVHRLHVAWPPGVHVMDSMADLAAFGESVYEQPASS